ncbi:Hsp70 family protein [Rhodococcus sp. GOMB7]|uniref:Hsp70 family protein n=2 Tax=Bacteria TaxID=2 RepID=UPI001C0029BB|nr:Hsp70 family protein [Rhodococcus sp. GOMB7]MBT9293374.1 Hsp70 family protein [Rhodococcus sp. GOMB7]
MVAIGIDLGTTYSCVYAADRTGRIELVRTPDDRELTPSVVHFSGSKVSVGFDAKEMMGEDPDNVVVGIKRSMGKDHRQEFGGVAYTPEAISGMILRRLAEDAALVLGVGISEIQAVITVPAYFGVAEKEATFAAARIAGLNCLELLAEPAAAAYAYDAADPAAGSSLVFDLGGGTFDVAVVAATLSGPPRIWAVDGESALGGLDWDQRMVELLWNKIEAVVEDVDDCRYDDEFVAVVGAEAERLKRELSVRESASGRFRFGKARFGITVTKGEFEAVCRDLVLQCHASVERVRRAAASLGAPPVARILMVGGSTRLPMIRDELNRMFDVPILIGDPDKVVAQGAARLAGRLAGSSAVHALSGGDRINLVLPRSIGLLIHSSAHPWREQPYVRHILKANTPLPVTKAATAVSTIFDNQDKVRIRLYEQAGAVESEDPADNRIIFDCEVSGLEKAPAGTEIKVLISVAVDGRLSVEMTDGRNRPLSMEAFMEGTLDEGEIVEQRQAVAGLMLST